MPWWVWTWLGVLGVSALLLWLWWPKKCAACRILHNGTDRLCERCKSEAPWAV